MASYDWINIEKPEDYEQLLGLDDEFEPRRIVEKLKAKITSRVKAVLVEHDYVDKDYRSTLYNFYAKKGRPYRADCVRLHFFDEKVEFQVRPSDEAGERQTLDHHYYGYMVLRPTIRATLGRSVLSPDIRVGAHGSAIQGRHYVHLLGHRLSVWGFPSMDQHVDIAACAHERVGRYCGTIARVIPSTGNTSCTKSPSLGRVSNRAAYRRREDSTCGKRSGFLMPQGVSR